MIATLTRESTVLSETAIQIRPASVADRESVMDLLFAFLEESDGGGAETLLTEGNVGTYGDILDSLLAGFRPGAAFLAMKDDLPVGFSMAGEAPMGLELRLGWCAMGLALYVVPLFRHRKIAARLRAATDAALERLGFDSVLVGYHPENRGAAETLRNEGFEPFQVSVAKRLREE